MAHKSAIEWTDATWNPWHGCHKVSAGCKNCYMFRDKAKYGQDPNVVVRSKTRFYDPLKWSEPRTIFTCSWSDFFIEEADPWRDEAFAIMALTPQHTYQVLTKRPDRMLEYLKQFEAQGTHLDRLHCWASEMADHLCDRGFREFERGDDGEPNSDQTYTDLISDWHIEGFIPNVWLGVSVEDPQHKSRIDILRQTPAAVRFLSLEPLLADIGEIDLTDIDWVIVGGESGQNARPMHPDWARSLRDQCTAAGVLFFFKQWGEWAPYDRGGVDSEQLATKGSLDHPMQLFGKKKAGRLLDGREWNEMPEVENA